MYIFNWIECFTFLLPSHSVLCCWKAFLLTLEAPAGPLLWREPSSTLLLWLSLTFIIPISSLWGLCFNILGSITLKSFGLHYCHSLTSNPKTSTTWNVELASPAPQAKSMDASVYCPMIICTQSKIYCRNTKAPQEYDTQYFYTGP